MTRVFVLTNNKGGCGKTTSAANIALGLSGILRKMGAPNHRVMLIDTGSQCHATLVWTDPDLMDNDVVTSETALELNGTEVAQ